MKQIKQLHSGVVDAIGHTPIVELHKWDGINKNVRIYGKLEGCNPGCSIKDRPAFYMKCISCPTSLIIPTISWPISRLRT